MKVNLKNMITDSLALYHRGNHPHIELLSQIQKVQVLMMKGMLTEALKMTDKVIGYAEQMELFTTVKYMLSIKTDIISQTERKGSALQEWFDQRVGREREISAIETDIAEWDKICFDAMIRLKGMDPLRPELLSDEISCYERRQPLSKRAELKKIRALYYSTFVNDDKSELLNIAKRMTDTAVDFRLHLDASYDDIGPFNNYLIALHSKEKMKAYLEQSDRMFSQIRHDTRQKQSVLIRYVMHKTTALLALGRFTEALQLLTQHEAGFYTAVADTGDLKSMVFIRLKMLSLFMNEELAAAWRLIQVEGDHAYSLNSYSDYADIKMLEMMIQLQMGNADLVRSLAKKYKKEFTAQKIASETYQILLKFFASKSNSVYKKEAGKALEELKQHNQNRSPRRIFQIIDYTYWLEEISGGKKVRESLEEYYQGKG